MEILPMTPDSLEAVHRLEALCLSQPWSLEGLQEELDNPNALYLTAQEGQEVLGSGGMQFAAGEFYITNLAVHPDCRRRGVGRALLQALVAFAAGQKGEFVSLEVRPSNLPAIGLYKSMGFVLAGRRRDFYSCPKEDGLIFTLNLKEEKP